jgi:mRNA interferase RelE/StbE
MYYIVVVIFYDIEIKKEMKKNNIPEDIVQIFHHAFQALDQSKDLILFDIKKLVANTSISYYRLRKGKYRAIFTIENQDFYVHAISKRSEVYKNWP